MSTDCLLGDLPGSPRAFSILVSSYHYGFSMFLRKDAVSKDRKKLRIPEFPSSHSTASFSLRTFKLGAVNWQRQYYDYAILLYIQYIYVIDLCFVPLPKKPLPRGSENVANAVRELSPLMLPA